MRRTGMLLGLFGLGLTGCPSDDSEGTGTDTDSGSSTSTSPSTSMTTAASTSSSTSSTTMEPTTEPTTDMTGTDVTTMPDTDTSGTTMAPDECTPCVAENCADQLGACADDKLCACWLDCTSMGNDEATCEKMCMDAAPMTLDDVFACIGRNCQEECFGGGSSSGSTGGGDGQYEPCDDMMMCPNDLTCNMFLGFCTNECMMGDTCPDPATGDAVPECSMISGTCILSCNGGETCPDGLECADVGGGNMLCGVPM